MSYRAFQLLNEVGKNLVTGTSGNVNDNGVLKDIEVLGDCSRDNSAWSIVTSCCLQLQCYRSSYDATLGNTATLNLIDSTHVNPVAAWEKWDLQCIQQDRNGSDIFIACNKYTINFEVVFVMLKHNVFRVLKQRGFIQALTCSEAQLEDHLNQKPVTCYIGFDPTAESLHVGNLLQLMCLRHMQDAGHQAVALVGGATGLIGDPSGRSTERPLLVRSTIDHNINGIAGCIKRVLHSSDHANGPPAVILNNHDWFKEVHLLDFLRDYGKLFKVQQMLNKNSVKSRMAPASAPNGSEGISFTEFSYQLLQAYDFYHLYKEKQCTLQIGGSDQWGNITSGIQLIHRLVDPNANHDEETSTGNHFAFGLTLPLITTGDGKKLGKSSSAPGAGIWLDPIKTKPYDLYQYLINLSDADAHKFLPLFTFLEMPEIESLISKHKVAPHHRLAQKTLSLEVVKLLHGEEEATKAQTITATFFGSNDVVSLDSLPSSTPRLHLTRSEVISQRLLSVIAKTSLFQTNKEAKRAVADKGLYMNNKRVEDVSLILTESDFKQESGEFLILQKGKKKFFIITIDPPEEK